MFDSNAEAGRAISALRKIGVKDSDLSVIAPSMKTTVTRESERSDIGVNPAIMHGVVGGGLLGAGLAVAVLAMPGVGPLTAFGAVAASAVPQALAFGAAAGAAAGSLGLGWTNGISDADASYYGERLTGGGVLIAVRAEDVDPELAQETLYRSGGHSSARPQTAVVLDRDQSSSE